MTIAEKLQTIAENETKVFEAGKKSQYDMFWDNLQNNGNRKNYYYAFIGRWVGNCWNQEIFNPKYPIICDGANTTNYMLFANARLYSITIPITIRNTTMVSTFVDMSELNTIADLTLENVTGFTNAFHSLPTLKELGIKGEIAANGFNVQSSKKLSHDSLISIINALKDYSEDTSGTVWVVTLCSDNVAKLSEDEKLIAENKGWRIE